MKLSELQDLISESIHKHLNEGENATQGCFEDIMYYVQHKAESYVRYAEQLQNEIKTVGAMCGDITKALSSVFNLKITTKDFHTCDFENARLEMYVSIPRENFAFACKNSQEIKKIHNEEYGSDDSGDDTSWIECGISYGDWAEILEDITGEVISNDKYHKFYFEPWKERNGVIICSVTIDGAFATYD